ncbi:peroxiredoxin-like family protein [Sphingobacterium sp.]|uniref:peroxiredoxin-like family protein n=1 Tax=Sphingobacterium sp. TaxID=341027 RepID=UPI0028A0F607|nr:peroxiredoxin-like family protein [Sphingobacterium sp.]
MKSLEHEIAKLNADLANLPSEVKETFRRSIEDLSAMNLIEKSIQVGDKFPDFSLLNKENKYIELGELLIKGKVIVAFFRGSWCPYCNLELRALQEKLPYFKEYGVSLLAISPQMPRYNNQISGELALDFELLFDEDNLLANNCGISFELQDYAISSYDQLGINLSGYNGNENNRLPVPAVFVIEGDYTISYRFMDVNYMNRLNVEELIAQL